MNKSTTVTFYAWRVALVSAVSVFLVFVMIRNLILASGLFPGADEAVTRREQELKDISARQSTIEGQFTDRNGAPITAPDTPGKPGKLLFDECYSYLIGYNSGVYGTSGLRKKLYHALYYGGADHVGASVQLTTDNDLQEFCYRQVLGSHEGSVIVMKPDTGELLACVSRSSASEGFNANEIDEKFSDYNQLDAFFMNRATFNQDPPGSTFKVITAASMIDNGMEDYSYFDETGEFTVGRTSIHNFGGAVYNSAPMNMEFALNHSVNVYFASAALPLTAGCLQNTAARFLFGQTVELDFATLTSNLDLGALNQPELLAQAAFGQGRLTTSPMQIVMIMGAVMNDGKMMLPYLIASTSDNGKTLQYSKPTKAADALSGETAASLRNYLHSNALHYGFDEEGYGRVYAKTGTADQANGKNHIYYLIGVETEKGDYAALIDWRESRESSSALKPSAVNLLRYLQSM